MLNSQRIENPQNTSKILKALLMGCEIETEQGIFKYFKKGEWVEIDQDTEGEIAQEGIFKRCEIIHHKENVKHNVQNGVTEFRWLLWLSSLADYVAWSETVTPAEMVKIHAFLALNKAVDYSRPISELIETIEL